MIGGMGNGDPGGWSIEGTEGPAAWGLWSGFHAIALESPVSAVRLDLLRGHEDHTIILEAYLGGAFVGSQTLTITGPFDSETAVFPGPLDEIVWDEACCYGIDTIFYSGLPVCP